MTAATERRRTRDPRSLVSTFVGYAILIFFGLVFLYPFVIQISNSFKSESDAAAHPLSPVPATVDLAGFHQLFATQFPVWIGNSLLVTVVVTTGRAFLDVLA